VISLVDSTGARVSALSAEITMPVRGNWVAHVELGTDAPVAAGPCTLEVERDGELGTVDVFAGTLRYGGTWQGRTSAVVVGGAGGLVAPGPASALRGQERDDPGGARRRRTCSRSLARSSPARPT
jgi:hypothetical protein